MTLARPAPAPVPSGRLVLRSRADVWRYGCCTAVAGVLISVFLVLNITMARSALRRGLINAMPLCLTVVTLLCLAAIFVVRGFTVIGTCTVVDARGLELRRSGRLSRFIPWEEAHRRITVKTVTEYAPRGSATMGMVAVGLDHEQVVLPGTLMRVRGQNFIEREVRGIAAQILSFDPWGQTSPSWTRTSPSTPWAVRRSCSAGPAPGGPQRATTRSRGMPESGAKPRGLGASPARTAAAPSAAIWAPLSVQ